MEFTSFLLLGLVYVIIGTHLKENPVRKMNNWWGYVSCSAKRSQEHWELAQKYSPKLYINYGAGLLVLSLIGNLIPELGTMDALYRVISLGILGLMPMIQTELELKKRLG